MPITRDQENQMVTALGAPVARQIINLLNAQRPTGPVVSPLVNHTQPTYVADTDYTETIDDVKIYLHPIAP